MVRTSALATPMNTARVAEQVRTALAPRTQTAAAPAPQAKVSQPKDSFKASGKAQVLNLSGRGLPQGEEQVGAYKGGAKQAEWSEEQVSEQARGSLAQLLVGEGMDAAAAHEFMTNLCSALEGNTSDLLGEELVDLSQEQTDGSVF